MITKTQLHDHIRVIEKIIQRYRVRRERSKKDFPDHYCFDHMEGFTFDNEKSGRVYRWFHPHFDCNYIEFEDPRNLYKVFKTMLHMNRQTNNQFYRKKHSKLLNPKYDITDDYLNKFLEKDQYAKYT